MLDKVSMARAVNGVELNLHKVYMLVPVEFDTTVEQLSMATAFYIDREDGE